MNNQEMFDKVSVHLIKQNTKCAKSCSSRYRLGELRCAIGVLIPDHLYSESLEGKPVSHLHPSFLKAMGIEDMKFAQELQYIHDGKFPASWYENLKQLAAEYELNTDAMDIVIGKEIEQLESEMKDE